MMTSIQPHGTVLVSQRCPAEAAGFSEQVESEELSKLIGERLTNEPQKPIAVTFEGTLSQVTLARRCWQFVAWRFGVHADFDEPIIIRRYVRIDDPSSAS
jgi:hypothetical protein